MATIPLYPLRFHPILKRLIWGGRRLESVLGKPLGPGEDYAESWEIADHRADVSQVAEGPLQGASLRDLLARDPAALLGKAHAHWTHFPLLIKFLDAHQVLSVQVHPDDTLAARLANDRGKTEAWVVMHAEPGSLIYAGLKAGVTRDQFARAIEANSVPSLLHSFEPRAGDCVFVPAGTVHALGAGVVVAEVQQMSDATFRIHDWGRLGADGTPRALHLAEALESINFGQGPVGPVRPQTLMQEPNDQRWRLVRCPHFQLDQLSITEPVSIDAQGSFVVLIMLEGAGEVRHAGVAYPMRKGQTLLLPAAVEQCRLVPHPRALVLACTLPATSASAADA